MEEVHRRVQDIQLEVLFETKEEKGKELKLQVKIVEVPKL